MISLLLFKEETRRANLHVLSSPVRTFSQANSFFFGTISFINILFPWQKTLRSSTKNDCFKDNRYFWGGGKVVLYLVSVDIANLGTFHLNFYFSFLASLLHVFLSEFTNDLMWLQNQIITVVCQPVVSLEYCIHWNYSPHNCAD